jgi:hypothetical protein
LVAHTHACEQQQQQQAAAATASSEAGGASTPPDSGGGGVDDQWVTVALEFGGKCAADVNALTPDLLLSLVKAAMPYVETHTDAAWELLSAACARGPLVVRAPLQEGITSSLAALKLLTSSTSGQLPASAAATAQVMGKVMGWWACALDVQQAGGGEQPLAVEFDALCSELQPPCLIALGIGVFEAFNAVPRERRPGVTRLFTRLAPSWSSAAIQCLRGVPGQQDTPAAAVADGVGGTAAAPPSPAAPSLAAQLSPLLEVMQQCMAARHDLLQQVMEALLPVMEALLAVSTALPVKKYSRVNASCICGGWLEAEVQILQGEWM